MIRFNDDWVIDVDAYNYILKRDLHKMEKSRDGKSMVPAYNTVGYYGSLRKALEHLREEIIRDKLRDGTHPLCEALQTIRDCTREWNEAVERIMSE